MEKFSCHSGFFIFYKLQHHIVQSNGRCADGDHRDTAQKPQDAQPENVEDLCHDLCVSTVAAKIIFKSHYLFLPKKKYLTK